ncbi:MAG: penicillin-binding protein 1C, partial [Enterobacteriaceae bacterium]
KSPIRLDTVYRPVVIDKESGQPACPPYHPERVRTEIYEYWPSDLAAVFARAGLSKKRAPDTSHCAQNAAPLVPGAAPQILSPLRNTTYSLRFTSKQRNSIVFNASSDGDSRTLYWFVDDIFLGSTASKQNIEWQPQKSGQYQVRAVDDHGRADRRLLTVELIE